MWAVVEENSFERSAAQLGGLKWVDRALAPVMLALEGNPLVFPVVPGTNGIRIARTLLVINELELIPSLRVWFRASEPNRTVYMLYVELAPPEDMGIGESI